MRNYILHFRSTHGVETVFFVYFMSYVCQSCENINIDIYIIGIQLSE